MARLRMTAVVRSSAELNQILTQILEENGVEPWEYSLDGYEDERQCLECDDGNWAVYFAERGQKRRYKTFESHKDAAQELLKRLGRDETQRAGLTASMERLWQPVKIMPSVGKDEMVRVAMGIEPIAAKPVVVIPVDGSFAGKNMKIAVAKTQAAMLNASHPYSRRAGKAARQAAKKFLAKKLKQKEKEEKLNTQIHTFGLKG